MPTTLDILPDDPPTIAEILRGERPFRVPLPVDVTIRALSGEDLAGLNVDEIVALAQEPGRRQKRKGEPFDVQIVASTADLVRDDAIVPTNSWDITDFLANPVILFAHNSFAPPIARSVSTELRQGAGEMRQFWLFNDLTELSREIHALFEVGAMSAASVGFMIRSFHRPDEKELAKLRKKFPRAGEFTWIIDLAELLETSAVPVPADPGALAVQGASLEHDLAAVYAEMGLRGPSDKEQFHLGGFAADQLPETRQHWTAALRFLADECGRGNEAACNCLTGDDHVKNDDTQNQATPFETLAARLARIDTALESAEADDLRAEILEVYEITAPAPGVVLELATQLEAMLRKHGDETPAFYREALRLALDNDGQIVKLGAHGAGFDVLLAEARFRAEFGHDPLKPKPEPADDDDTIRLVGLDGETISFVD